MRFTLTIAAFAVSCFQSSRAQQYSGDLINTNLPRVPGSEVAYFRIKDASGKNNNLTLINYYSHAKNDKRLTELNVQRAVVIIHGLNRDPGTYMSNMLSALSQVQSDPNINFDSVAIMAPYFPNGDDKNTGYPWTEGLKPARGSTSNTLVWKGSQWSAGGNNQYPYTSTTTSSYTVLDQIIQYFDNKQLFPNMNQIVIAGHSLGAQTVQRYAALGAQLDTQTPVSYWVGNPNSYVWLSSKRPLSTASCPSFDDYREGYNKFTDYPMTFGASLVASGRDAILANFQSKAINYARGTQDLGDDSSSCAPGTTGANRNERFFNFIKAFPPSCPDSRGRNCDTVDFVNAGHDGGAMMASSAGQARLFIDNFYGTGNRSYDFGYPRQQAGDDPFPNPALNGTTSSTDNKIYAGNMTYWGCWSDQSPQTLASMAYTNDANTIEKCTQTCADAGNNIAGLEYGTQCFCGKSLGYLATQVVESSCSFTCPGNSSQACGGSGRLSLFSNGRPALQEAPGTPETVGDFYYVSCYTEAINGARALADQGTSSSSMTLESCASFCLGYRYFGTEYGGECYCGNDFSAGANRTKDGECNMLCTGATNQFCGAGNRLTVYQDPNWTAGSSSSSTSTRTATSTSTSASASATALVATAIACPSADGTTVASNGKNFTIECGIDHQAGDLSSQGVGSFQQCVDACAQNEKCVVVALSGSACYLKSSVGAPVSNGVWGARLVTWSSSSMSSSSTSAAITSTDSGSSSATGFISAASSTTGHPSSTISLSASATATSLNCPSANGTTHVSSGSTFLIECGIDHAGGDMKAVGVNSLAQCIDECATTPGCVDVSYTSVCYLKSTLGTTILNNGVNGAKLLSAVSSSSSLLSQSPSQSTSISSSTSGSTISSLTSTSSSSLIISTGLTLLTSTTPSSSSPSLSLGSGSSSSISYSSSASDPITSSSSSSLTTSTFFSSFSDSTTVPANSALPSGYSSVGCYVDSGSSRVMPKFNGSTSFNTPQSCALACSGVGYKYSGTEYGAECWCGNNDPPSSSIAPAGNCNTKCSGDATQLCGAGNRLSIVLDTAYKPSFFIRRTYGSSWTVDNCYADGSPRTLKNAISLALFGGSSEATVANCLDACDNKGYQYCGLEYYSECWGSNDVPSGTGLAGPTHPPPDEQIMAVGCNFPCNGNKTEACGGSNRLLVYNKLGGN